MERKKKSAKRLISLFILIASIFSLIPSNVVSSQSYIGNTGTGVDVGGWSGKDGTTTRPIMIPPFNVNGVTAYVVNFN